MSRLWGVASLAIPNGVCFSSLSPVHLLAARQNLFFPVADPSLWNFISLALYLFPIPNAFYCSIKTVRLSHVGDGNGLGNVRLRTVRPRTVRLTDCSSHGLFVPGLFVLRTVRVFVSLSYKMHVISNLACKIFSNPASI